MIYLDHNATTPLDERVLETMLPYFTQFYGNPSSLYRAGRIARDAIETAREQVAALVGAHPSQVVFTSGGTEANNLALTGLAGTLPVGSVAAGATEHPSVLETLNRLVYDGWTVQTLTVDENGVIDPTSMDRILSCDLRFVSIMLANNETGVIQDIAGLVDRLRVHSLRVHCDAIQAAGKIPVDFSASNTHLMSLSAHKFYGPKGVGALVVDKSLTLEAILHGGGQERNLRGGTENVPAIAGFGRAAEIAIDEMNQRSRHLLNLRNRLETGLKALSAVTIFAEHSQRLPNTVQFSLDGIDGEMLLMQLDRHGIAVSSGSACSSGGHEPSHVLLAMGVEPTIASGAVRVSLGSGNSEAEIDRFLSVLRETASALNAGHSVHG